MIKKSNQKFINQEELKHLKIEQAYIEFIKHLEKGLLKNLDNYSSKKESLTTAANNFLDDEIKKMYVPIKNE